MSSLLPGTNCVCLFCGFFQALNSPFDLHVAGVHLKNGKTVSADLVVDASGKGSEISSWLQQIGHTPPDTISVASGLRYTYRMYEMTDDPERDWSVAVCMDHPEYNRTAVVIPIETNKWIVSLQHLTESALQQLFCVQTLTALRTYGWNVSMLQILHLMAVHSLFSV